MLDLSHYYFSLSYSWLLRYFFEHSWRVWHTWIPGARRKRKRRKSQEGIGIKSYIKFSCKYRVACMISSLVLACMAYACGFLVVICHWHGGLPGSIVDFLWGSLLGPLIKNLNLSIFKHNKVGNNLFISKHLFDDNMPLKFIYHNLNK